MCEDTCERRDMSGKFSRVAYVSTYTIAKVATVS